MDAWSRRRFLKVGAGGALAALNGGCKSAPPISAFPPNCGLPPPEAGKVTIDVHTHVFNATDLQVERFITRVAASEVSPIFRPVLEALASILELAGWAFAPDGKTELERLGVIAAKAQQFRGLGLELQREFAADREFGRQQFLNGFSDVLKTPAGERFLKAYDAYRRSVRTTAPGVLRDSGVFALDLAITRSPAGLAAFVEAERRLPGKRPFDFVANFFNYRYVNALFLLENYGCANGKVGIFACHMVDFDYGLGVNNSPPPTNLDTQIEVMSQIHLLSDGRIFPFVPFDPWRASHEASALPRVQSAIQNGHCLGVKLYPPMGFAPAGNADIKPRPAGWPSDPRFSKGLDDAMKGLLEWCAKEEVPILAHANRSNAAHPSFLDLGGPDNWKTALAAHPNLRVCFGHFGGDCLLEQTNDCSGWAEGFLDAIAHARHAYADWSYFEHVLPGEDRKALTKRAKALFEKGGNTARSRIVYGSDWMMLAIEAGSELYYEEFAKLEQELEQDFSGIGQDFFVKNGVRFLGLGPKGASRARVERTFSRQKMRPAWLDAPILQAE